MQGIRGIACCFAALFAIGGPRAQQPTESSHVEVRLVQVEVRVTTPEGLPVENLGKKEVTLRDNGRVQEIRNLTFISRPSREANDQVEPEAASSPDPSAESATPQAWVYIATEFGSASQFVRAVPSIRAFIQDRLEPGVMVSLGGMPFTTNRQLLLGILQRMAAGPYGGDGRSAAVEAGVAHLQDLEFERLLAEAVRQEHHELTPLTGFGRDPWFAGQAVDVRFYTIERIDRQVPLFGQLALLRYRELVERLAVLPGRKAIVLFRPGLRLDKDTARLLRRVTTAAQQERVSFYSIDPQGLDTIITTEDRRATLAWEARGYRPSTNYMRVHQDSMEGQAGLAALSKETGGSALTNTNDMGLVLDRVVDDAYDYYLIEYYPDRRESGGKFHKVEVSVSRPGVKVADVDGYYEPVSGDLTEIDRGYALANALISVTEGDFPIDANLEVFAGEDLSPVVFYSAGVRPTYLLVKPNRKEARATLAGMSRLSSLIGVRLPQYEERKAEYLVPRQQWDAMIGDPSSTLSLNSTFTVPPGVYLWKIALQDETENSGRIGVIETRLSVPDFSAPSTPSSLLLTSNAVPLEQVSSQSDSDAADPGDSDPLALLNAGDHRYFPQPSRVFRQGEVIHFTYHLYNPSEEDLEIASQTMQIGLLRDGVAITGMRAGGMTYPDQDGKVIRFAGFLLTENLLPGEYRFMAILPGYMHRDVPHLERDLKIIP